MTKNKYRVRFERTLHEKTTVEGSLTLAAPDESEVDPIDQIAEEVDDVLNEEELKEINRRVEEEEEEINGEPEDDEVEVVYNRIRYQEVSIEGEAPVVAESASEAGEKFLAQVRSTRARENQLAGEIGDEFRLIQVDKE